MIELHIPHGIKVEVPETTVEDNTPRFDINGNMESAISY